MKVYGVICRSNPWRDDSWPTTLAVCDSLELARESIAAKIEIAPSWANAEWRIEEYKVCDTVNESLLWHVTPHQPHPVTQGEQKGQA